MHFVTPTTARPCPTQVARVLTGEGFSTIVVRPEGAVGARDDARARVRRRRASAATSVDRGRRRSARAGLPAAPNPASRTSTSTSSATSSLRSATKAGRSASGSWRAPVREVDLRRRRRAGLRLARRYTVAAGDGPATARRGGAVVARQRAAPRRGRPTTARTSIATADGLRVRGLGRLVDGGDGGDTYNYSPPAEDVRRRPARVASRSPRSSPVPVRARCASTPTYRWPDARDRRRALVLPARRRDHAPSWCTRPWSSAPVSGSCRVHTELDNRAATIGCGRTSRCRRR